MTTFFIACAILGGTVLLAQFVLALVGVLDFDIEVVDDVGSDGLDAGHHGDHFVATWLWGVISIRTVTAALTFFGLAGMAMHARGATPLNQIVVATVAGLAGMYGVHGLMRALYGMARDSTIQLSRAIGQTGTVYLTVPALKASTGKVHISVGGRLEELAAVTPSSESLPVGAKVVVTAIEGTDTLEVVLAPEQADKKLTSSV